MAVACVVAIAVFSPGRCLSESDTASAFALASGRNPSLLAYDFEISVALRMQHFPWLRFHIAGAGEYDRGKEYTVKFTKLPFFAKGPDTIDLSALDPSMWPAKYVFSLVGMRGPMMTFVLRPKEDQGTAEDPLIDALVTLDANYATREVVLRYRDGAIKLALRPQAVQGYRLPVSADVTIDMPGRHLSAQATFSNYTITDRLS
jgi:hypothetical protein